MAQCSNSGGSRIWPSGWSGGGTTSKHGGDQLFLISLYLDVWGLEDYYTVHWDKTIISDTTEASWQINTSHLIDKPATDNCMNSVKQGILSECNALHPHALVSLHFNTTLHQKVKPAKQSTVQMYN